jgi:hypothetical protein
VPSEDINAATRSEWRSLGFFYDRDDELKKWRILGTNGGLREFARQIRLYASNPKNRGISEHEHFGPYQYLKIGTWPSAQITQDWIAGPLESLERLASEIDLCVMRSSTDNSFKLRHIFSPDSPYELLLELQPEGFDPALADAASS